MTALSLHPRPQGTVDQKAGLRSGEVNISDSENEKVQQ
jgi:hypothetical protein